MNLQVLIFNIHKGRGWGIPRPTIHQIQNQMMALGSDIIFLQEVHGSHFEVLIPHICEHYSYTKHAKNRKGCHGNAILSQFPIVFTNNIDLTMHRYESRSLLHSVIKLPEYDQPLHLFCVHLGLFRNDRRKQLDIVIDYIKKNVPQDEPIILGGDFNDWNVYATKLLLEKLAMQEAFFHMHRSHAKTYPAWVPTLKLDRLYFRGFEVNYAKRLTKKNWRFLSDHIALEVSLNLVRLTTPK